MGRGPRYRVAFRRRRTNLTNYRMRKAMLFSDRPRLVVRLSLKYIYTQVVEASMIGDKTLACAYSKELEKFGWKASYKNTSAAYLTGLLLGIRSLAIGIDALILDIGLKRPSAGAKVFAVLKGVADTGLKIPYNQKILPSEERIKGEHIASYARMLEAEQQYYDKAFSQYLIRSLKPENLVNHFNVVRNNVLNTIQKSDK